MTNAEALQAYSDSWYRAPQPGQARRVPAMGWLHPQQTTEGTDLGAFTTLLALNAAGDGGDIEGGEFPSRRRTMRTPAAAKPRMMNMSKPMTAMVVPVPLLVLREGSLETSTVEE